MAESTTTEIVVPEKRAGKFQITHIGLSFYDGGGEWSKCTMQVRGRIGYGDGAQFTEVRPFDCSLHNLDLLPVLGQSVATLPECFDKTNPDHVAAIAPTYLWRAMLNLVSEKIKAIGVV